MPAEPLALARVRVRPRPGRPAQGRRKGLREADAARRDRHPALARADLATEALVRTVTELTFFQ
ncbi:hypothetical protein ACH429_11125 [Streptomyces pathocidini]|uniref:Uncharacterized protein n=1 Tax=Streptomyces pathocidini TaxID=1650571 RepID=A0ABW7UQ91_9ACTN